jgi:hypothetical protein
MPIETIFADVGNERVRFDIPVTIFQRRVRITTIHGLEEEYVIRCDQLDITCSSVFERIARENFVNEFESLCNWCWFGETVAQRIQRDILRAFMVEGYHQ